jgi:hypothetical protein
MRESAGGDVLATWPTDMRVIVRRERPHPGAQLSLFEERDGWRYQLFATNTPLRAAGRLGQLAFLEARHRSHARVEDTIRNGKNTGLNHLPSNIFRDQPGLVPRRRDRLRPAGLAPAALPDRGPGQGRTQDPALPAPAHQRPPDPRTAPAEDPHPRHLALGGRPARLPDRRAQPAPTGLTARPCPNNPRRTTGPWSRRPPTRHVGHQPRLTTRNRR